jgi:hypothetical protein
MTSHKQAYFVVKYVTLKDSSHSRQQILDLHLTRMDVLLTLGGLIYPDNLVIKKPIWLLVSVVQLGAWSS